jgi:hypothetical protein
MSDVNFHFRPPSKQEKTAALICNWCREPHSVEPEYREEMLKRGAEKIKEARETQPDALPADITEEDTWTCGKCLARLMGLPDDIKTDCHDHEVPKERKK